MMKTKVGKAEQVLQGKAGTQGISRPQQDWTKFSSEAAYAATQGQRMGRWPVSATRGASDFELQHKTDTAAAQPTVFPDERRLHSPGSSIQRVIIGYEKEKSVPLEAIEDLTEEQQTQIQLLHGHQQRYKLKTAIAKVTTVNDKKRKRELPKEKEKENTKDEVPLDEEITSEEVDSEIDEKAVIDEELRDWLESGGAKTSEYWEGGEGFGPKKVNLIVKNDIDLACWNWALRALSDQGGPSPAEFWNYILVPDQEEPKWMKNLTKEVKSKINGVTKSISQGKLSIDPFSFKERKYSKNDKILAAKLLSEASSLLVQLHGFKVVSDTDAACWVVCQYKYNEGAALPEHWWIELPGDVVIQTVPGKNIEIGGSELRWHSEGGRLEEDAPQYGTIRTPVSSLTGPHVDLLKEGMKEASKTKHKKKKK